MKGRNLRPRLFVQKVAERIKTCYGAIYPLASAWKTMNTIEEYEGLSLVDTRFAPRDSPRALNFILAMSPSTYPLTLLMGVRMIPNIHPLTRYCERHSWGGGNWGGSLEPACRDRLLVCGGASGSVTVTHTWVAWMLHLWC